MADDAQAAKLSPLKIAHLDLHRRERTMRHPHVPIILAAMLGVGLTSFVYLQWRSPLAEAKPIKSTWMSEVLNAARRDLPIAESGSAY